MEGCSCSPSGGHDHNPPTTIIDSPDNSTTETDVNDTKNNEKKSIEILNRMVTVYRNAKSYADHGRGLIVGKMTQPDAEPVTWSCTVAIKKPSKLRIECNEGKLVSNGSDCYAQIRALPDQVLRFSTPNPLTFDKLFNDVELDQAMNIVFPSEILRFPPQLILLFATDPLKTFLPEGATTELLQSQSIGNIPCDVIKIKHERGDRALWISRRNSALLRFDYMVEGLLVAAEFESVRTIRIEMNDAQFDLPIAEEAFQMMQPTNAKQVSEFKPVETEILGKNLTNPESLKFKELILDSIKTTKISTENPSENSTEKTTKISTENPTNNSTEKTNIANDTKTDLSLQKSISDLQGKISAFCFWTTWSEPCRQAIEEFYKAEDENANKNNIQFFVINADEIKETEKKTLPDLLKPICKTWSLRKPYWHELDGKLTDALSVDSFPTIVVLGVENRVEFYSRGGMQAAAINSLLKEIEEGKKPYEKTLNELQKTLQQRKIQHANELKIMTDKGIFASICVPIEKPTTTELVPQSPPKTFKLNKLWELPLASTGNIAVLKVKNSDKKINNEKNNNENFNSKNDEKLDSNLDPIQNPKPDEKIVEQTDKKSDEKKSDNAELDKQSETNIINATKNQNKPDKITLLVPCEGNSVALIDLSGKLIKKITPEGFSNDELLTLVRTSVDLSGSYVGFSSNNGNAVHVFDSELKSRLRYVPQSKTADTKLKIADFQFVDADGINEPEVVVGVVAIDGDVSGGDSICTIDLNGKEIWRDDTITSPFQIGDYNQKDKNQKDKRGLYSLDASNSVVKLQKYSADGKRLETLSPNGASVRCFSFDVVSGDLCTIISAPDGERTSIAVLNDSGSIRWQSPLPVGEYNLLAADLLDESKRAWIVVSQLGVIFVFDQTGKQVDSFSIGESVTGLVIVERQLVVATGNKVIAWKISK
jgi:thiol-disulfide isomerase/thioredoxin